MLKPLPQKAGNFQKVADIFTPLIKQQHSEEPMGVMKFWLPILFAQLTGISLSLLFFFLFFLQDWQCYSPTGAVDAYFAEEQYYLLFQYIVIYLTKHKYVGKCLQCPALHESFQVHYNQLEGGNTEQIGSALSREYFCSSSIQKTQLACASWKHKN